MSDDTWVNGDPATVLRIEQERTRQIEVKSETRKMMLLFIAIAITVISVAAIIGASLLTAGQRNAQLDNAQALACLNAGGSMIDVSDRGPTCLWLRGAAQ